MYKPPSSEGGENFFFSFSFKIIAIIIILICQLIRSEAAVEMLKSSKVES